MTGKLRVVILTEGGKDTGLGHITRCISLYQAFEDRGISPGLIVNCDESVLSLLKDKNFRILNWMNEKEDLLNAVKQADVAVVDSYLAGADVYETIAETTELAVYIDDNKRLDYPKGIIVNGSIDAESMNYLGKEGTAYLLGTRYIPLRKEFWDAPEKPVRETIESAIITFGGDDAMNLAPKALKVLAEDCPMVRKKAVIGQGFSNIGEIEASADKNTDLIYYPDSRGMRKAMLESDLAISAGGQTLYELARMGIPTIAIAAADNQLNNIYGWERKGFVKYAGWGKDANISENIRAALKLLEDAGARIRMSKAGREMVDGQGAKRTVAGIIGYRVKSLLSVRKAVERDMMDIFNLTNEPEVRQNSFSIGEIEFEHHKEWFMDKIKGDDCLFLVAEAGNEFLGQVRFDIKKDEAVAGISMCVKYRGLGIGKDMLRKGIDILKSGHHGTLSVKAYIKEGNVFSIRLFEECGFAFAGQTEIKNQKALEYLYRI